MPDKLNSDKLNSDKLNSENLNHGDYFKLARSWADDYSVSLELSRRRYQTAFLAMAALVFVLIISLISILPLKKIQLAIVHEGPEWRDLDY